METKAKHPLHDLFKQQKLVMDALVMELHTKPIKMEIVNGVAYPINSEPTEFETNLHNQLRYIDEKIQRCQSAMQKLTTSTYFG